MSTTENVLKFCVPIAELDNGNKLPPTITNRVEFVLSHWRIPSPCSYFVFYGRHCPVLSIVWVWWFFCVYNRVRVITGGIKSWAESNCHSITFCKRDNPPHI
jgi:hypothetical protein